MNRPRRTHPFGTPLRAMAPALRTRLALISLMLGGPALAGASPAPGTPPAPAVSPPGAPAKRPVTFNRDVAPILFRECLTCHREGQAAPLALTNYLQARRRARQIVDVTQSRYMPPWPPEPGLNQFEGERLLSPADLQTLQAWVAQGTPEGDAADLPPLPAPTDQWPLGTPDLVITLPDPYLLPAEGKDVYRNFVIPIPVETRRYVEAMDLRGGGQSLHHAFMLLDPTDNSRRIDVQDATLGFPGMSLPSTVQSPPGQFASWQPGKVPKRGTPATIWTLDPRTSLVLQMHLQPTGKPEPLQPSVGFYFTDHPPSQTVYKIGLSSYALDIPPGDARYTATDKLTLPVDVEVLAVLPHAHYLGREIQGYGELPDGSRRWLLRIPDWDFNWQGDYRYAEPVRLPKGTTLHMQWTFDNSTNNVRNPFDPPVLVRYGQNTTNEMAELWFQLRLNHPADLAVLQQAYGDKVLVEMIELNRRRIRDDPNDVQALNHLGQALHYADQPAEAESMLQRAIALKPDFDEAHFNLGLLYRHQKRLQAAGREFAAVLRINPRNAKAYDNLGFIFAELGDLERSEQSFRFALQFDPNDADARKSLEELARAKAQRAPRPAPP